jgi:hypothetical protein
MKPGGLDGEFVLAKHDIRAVAKRDEHGVVGADHIEPSAPTRQIDPLMTQCRRTYMISTSLHFSSFIMIRLI